MAEAIEEIIKETCKEFNRAVIDMAMNVDHIHLFIHSALYQTFSCLQAPYLSTGCCVILEICELYKNVE